MTARPAWRGLALLAVCVASACDLEAADAPAGRWHDDVSRLNRTEVDRIVRPTTVEEIRAALALARRRDLPVSISAKRHSQGGHVLYERALVLDMMDFDEILEVDPDASTVRVQSGATWAEVQAALDPHGLAVAVMQSSNIFSVGGSLGSNCHGRDPRFGPIIDSVRSFRLCTAAGQVLHVDRETNSELFGLVIGGFGLFGVILDVTLEVVPNERYERHIRTMDYRDYPREFRERVLSGRPVGLCSGRLSISPGPGFLRDMYDREYVAVGPAGPSGELRKESDVRRDRFFFGLSRRFDWGKKLRWFLQRTLTDRAGETKRLTRNNAMRPPIAFLEYHSDDDTDILQEYFVPIDSFVSFVDGLRDVMVEDDVNLLHATVRYVPENGEAFLSYATAEMFAIVLYMNIGLASDELARAERWTRKLVDLAHGHGGTYFLVYQRFPSREQIRQVYPRLDEFFARKRAHDPESRFLNRFYGHYAGAG